MSIDHLADEDISLKILEVLQKLPQFNQQIIGRLWMLVQHILACSKYNKMTEKSISIVVAPLLFKPAIENVIAHTQLFSLLVTCLLTPEQLRITCNVLPKTMNYVLYRGPGKLSESDWTLIMTRAEVESYSKGAQILPDVTIQQKLYQLSSGAISLFKDGELVCTIREGQLIPKMAVLEKEGMIAIATRASSVVKLSVPFLTGLFETDRSLYFRFFWEQARACASHLASLPFIMTEKEEGSSTRTTKIEIHLNTGGSHWMEFPVDITVAKMHEMLIQTFPKLKRARLVETSEGEQPLALQLEWTVQELLVRAKYASDYKILFVSEESPKDRKHSRKENLEDALVIGQYECKRKKFGTLLVMQRYLLHTSKLFGMNSKLTLNYHDILSCTQRGKSVMITANLGKIHEFVFSSENEALEVRQLLKSLSQGTLFSPRARKQSSDGYVPTDWAIMLKPYKILQPVLIELKSGDVVSVVGRSSDLLSAIYRGQRVQIPIDYVEDLPCEDQCTLLSPEASNDPILYRGVLQTLNNSNWASILANGTILRYSEGETIIAPNSKLQRIFQVVSGTCLLRTVLSDKESSALSACERWRGSISESPSHLPFSTLTLKTLREGETFGEIGLLLGESSSASVEASSPETIVFVMEAARLDALFSENPKIGGRFASYLNTILDRRIQFETQTRMVV